ECGAAGLFVKRVIGLPGDVWAERRGHVYIDGRPLSESYVPSDERDSQTLTMADIPPTGKLTRIRAGRYLVMGDNRNSSCDSRRWGLVPHDHIIAIAFAIQRGSTRIDLH